MCGFCRLAGGIGGGFWGIGLRVRVGVGVGFWGIGLWVRVRAGVGTVFFLKLGWGWADFLDRKKLELGYGGSGWHFWGFRSGDDSVRRVI
jgi:hypothetical protein